MRVIESEVGNIRRKVFKSVAELAFEGGDYSRIEDLPYQLVPGEIAKYRESIFLERAIVGERLRLAIGLPLRSMAEHKAIADGIMESVENEKYYDPPLINIIKFACHKCQDRFFITNGCQGCLARPCVESCPKDAIIIGDDRRAYIDQEKCIKCGRCHKVCSYDAIVKQQRPCAEACGVDAIGSDEQGRAIIDQNKCVSCGMCIVNCPFGAISDKGQIFQMVHALKNGEKLIAIVAPAFVGQFGHAFGAEKVKGAIKSLGFYDVEEVAVGADLCAIQEAREFVRDVPDEIPFMATSCCPAWAVMAKRDYPEYAHCVSMALTPMVLTARMVKKKHPDAKIAFIGPCSAKKLEARRSAIRSDVDFVLTFEEMMGVFEAKCVDFEQVESDKPFTESSASGRGFAVSGGVALAVTQAVKRIDPDREVQVFCAEGLRECGDMMNRASKGEFDGYLLEGMACPGGCVAGTGTRIAPKKTEVLVNMYKKTAALREASDSEHKDMMFILED
ncbi:MAG: 4Fe-4S dicluster domain-containing protein [Clostridiales bacterium]|jgi:[FeFe] hydrogenase (group B1/B3)|nr:4Fe-4S dicluster domain-containing protein [Clostridiales bacterium]